MEISTKSQKIVDEATKYGLDLKHLARFYGIRFSIKLFNYLKEQIGKKETPPIYPKKYSSQNKSIYYYMEALQDSGFELKLWVKDFIDEETGELFYLQKFNFKRLKLVKPKKQ